MKFNDMLDAESMDDARLVGLSSTGDRDAFGRLVARYQSPLCALAYSACGNLSQSQDLAQETFIIAWRKLADLKEPAKFKPWLYGIARNLINNAFRQQTRNPLAGAELLDENLSAFHTASNPLGQAISQEEEGILWRSLEQIPDTYREPLILFYREQQSTERVAAIMELSEEVVRQRLSRGRKLLQEQVMAFVEGTLARTGPGQVFTLNVLSALPPFAIAASSSAIGGTFLKGSAAGKAAASGGVFAFVLGPLLGLLGTIFGTWALACKLPESSRERKFAIKAWTGLWVGTILYFLAVSFCTGLSYWHSHPQMLPFLLLASCFGYCVILGQYTFWMARVTKRIRSAEVPPTDLPAIFSMTKPYEYRSRQTLLGLPLVHVRFNCVKDGKTLPAFGWIACGNRAYGIIAATGIVAVGCITMAPISIGLLAIGGFGVGFLAFGGMAVGGIAMGGGAIGYLAFGGGSIGWLAAYGGSAWAHHFALGGSVVAQHANDRVAWEFMHKSFFFRNGWNIFAVMIVICWLPTVIQVWLKVKRDRQRAAAAKLAA